MPPERPRYVLYPDHLVTMPPAARLADWLREPLLRSAVWPALGYLARRLTNPPGRAGRQLPAGDLSVAEWLHHVTMGRTAADNFASAVVHGIYGGDVDQLSARSVLDGAYWAHYLPPTASGRRQLPAREEALLTLLGADAQIRRLALSPKGSLLHFGGAGMESLPVALAAALATQANVRVQTGARVRDITHDAAAARVHVSTARGSDSYDRVISTLPAQDLARVTGGRLPSLAAARSVSIWTVNVWYPRPGLIPPGLGYLIPRSVAPEHNPERALGVFFDSDVGAATRPDEPPGTKLFVLLGGHHYDAGAPPPRDEAEAVGQAKAVVARHLGIAPATPCFAMARLARECVPQHLVGHDARLARADAELRAAYAGRLAVAGGSYGRIGALGALRAAFDVAATTTAAAGAPARPADADTDGWLTTGLEHLAERSNRFVSLPLSSIPVRRFRR